MPDDAPQTGQRVFRAAFRYPPGDDTTHQYREGIAKYGYEEQGVWHSLDPKALAEMRDALVEEYEELLASHRTFSAFTLAAIARKALGLTPPEPKEGGAS